MHFFYNIIPVLAQSQKLELNEPTFDDYLPLLNAMGYRAYSFDTRTLKGKKVTVGIKEYVDGKEVRDVTSGFPYQFSYPINDKIIIGFLPLMNDSTSQFVFDLVSVASFSSVLTLKPISLPQDSKSKKYQYESKPFELPSTYEPGVFIPLVLYGSWWYDEYFNITRFCVDNFIKPDLSTETLTDIKNFYVFGITVAE